MADSPIERLIHLSDVPSDVVVIASTVEADEVLPGETIARAMARLNRAVVLHTTSPEDRCD
ncbi:hypothetical protein [Micromonospora sp. CA-248212]|uniref:hypothetical protein n=1 Tax=Micromonospora sp. CA-248212 TaxID=3239961 RepID=UPI003D8DA133